MPKLKAGKCRDDEAQYSLRFRKKTHCAQALCLLKKIINPETLNFCKKYSIDLTNELNKLEINFWEVINEAHYPQTR